MPKIVYLAEVKTQYDNSKPIHTPNVVFTTVSYQNESVTICIDYKIRHLIEIDGTPFGEFLQTDWLKIPKGQSISTINWHELHEITYKEHAKHAEDIMAAKISNTQSLYHLIETGVMVPAYKAEYHIETECSRDKKYYRLIKKPDSRHTLYSYSMNTSDVYDTYDEALQVAQRKCELAYTNSANNLEMDFDEDCSSVIAKMPRLTREMLFKLPHDYGFSFRCFGDKLLYRKSGNDEYTIIYDDSISCDINAMQKTI